MGRRKMMDIEFTRGDTQVFKFQIKDGKENPIALTSEDKLYFTVKQNSNSEEILLQKIYPENIEYLDGYFTFIITSEDTSNLMYGTYNYDIEFKSGDYVKTLGQGTITLTDEITFRSDE
jgi:hypothetical protein